MYELLRSQVGVVLPVMLALQSFGTMCSYAAPVVVVQAAAGLGVKSTSIGIYSAVLYSVGMLAGLVASGFFARFGVVRCCQVAMLFGALGLALTSALPFWPVAIVTAVLIGSATGPLNPAGSAVLARHTPPRWQPLVFSVKQTGTPLGGMLAGLLLPPLVALYDWRIALVIVAALPLLTLAAVQPVRAELDDDRDPRVRIGLAGVAEPLRVILANRPLVTLAAAGYLYTFSQLSVLAFMVIYLEEANGLSNERAGAIFALIHMSAIPARIMWGLIAGRWLSTWVLLGIIGLLMAAAILATSLFSPAWPFWAMALVAVLLGATSNGVIGLLLSEFARLAPPGKVGEAAGGAQFFLFFGIVSGPPAFGAIVEYGNGYTSAFYVVAAATFAAGVYLLLTARRAR